MDIVGCGCSMRVLFFSFLDSLLGEPAQFVERRGEIATFLEDGEEKGGSGVSEAEEMRRETGHAIRYVFGRRADY